MGVTITKREKKPLAGVAGRYGIQSGLSVRGLSLPISEDACYVSLTTESWRYWVRPESSADGADSFANRVGGLVPLNATEFMARLNDHATGPIQPSFWKRPSGEAIVFDLPDREVLERFALTCAFGEALSQSKHVNVMRAGHEETRAKVIQDALPDLNVNLSLWAVDAPQLSLVVFPNALLLRHDRHQWVVPFAEAAVQLDPVRDPDAPSEIRLALSDQHVRLHLSDHDCAHRATQALRKLIAFESRKGTHLGPEGPKRRRISNTSCGRIVITQKGDAPPDDRIVVRVNVGADVDPPPPAPDPKLPAPAAPEENELIFCDDSGLTFATESPRSGDSDVAPVGGSDSDLGIVLSDEAPKARSPRPSVQRAPAVDRVRAAVGALMAYVAKTSDGFTPPEQRVIRELLELPASFQLERGYSAVRPGSPALARATGVLRELTPALRERALQGCERVANADGSVTPQERERLTELRDALEL